MISRIARVGRVARAGGGAGFSTSQLTSLGALYTSGPAREFTDAPPGTTPIVNDTDLVRTWRDATANAFHLTQATAGNRPVANLTGTTWRSTGNGTSVVVSNAGAVSLSNATGFSMAIAFLPTTSTGASRCLTRTRDSATGDLMTIIKSSTDKLRGNYRTSTGVKAIDSAASITTAIPCSAIWSVDTSLNYIHRLNGVELTGTLAGAFTGITADTVDVLSDTAAFFDGAIFEVLIRRVPMTAGDITNIEADYRTRYGTP